MTDQVIVRAAIHPGIGIARVGDAQSEFYIGPEVTHPSSHPSGFYRTEAGALKREAARFRLYGYNAAGEVVRELTPADAKISWSAHLANRKADWFQFITALDIPETKDLTTIRRNKSIKGDSRKALVIDAGSRSISGISTCGGKQHSFDTGAFQGNQVYLGELQTDERGHLLVLGGRGVSKSTTSNPPYDKDDPDSFNNANNWYDDIADGPVDAIVSIAGQDIPVEGSWVVVAPPNYAPDIIGWRTFYDLLVDVYIGCGWLPVPETTSFSHDVLPQLQRLSNLQWVNKGFATMFGKGSPMDFNNDDFIAQLAQSPGDGAIDVYKELRTQILNAFRPFDGKVNEPRIWPWIYGDDYGEGISATPPNTMLALPKTQQMHLKRWAQGAFIADWQPDAQPPLQLSNVALQDQPAMLDKAALHFCLADAFHPGCEMTWPMRHATMYQKPFRIRRRKTPEAIDEYGATLDQQQALALEGPLNAQGPGGLSRWMGLPWQGDTAYCRSGYDIEYDLYLPTFWPARVPNTVLSKANYDIVINELLPREQRIVAYRDRVSWNRFMDTEGSIAKVMEKMIATFGAQGIVEALPGIVDDPDFPAVMYVENVQETDVQRFMAIAKTATKAAIGSRQADLEQAGWTSEQHLQDAKSLRARKKPNA